MSKVKLLSKKDIDVKKAQERQREIDEGLKLARRVDGLRELAASEEAGLEKFRIETLTRINDEILAATDRLTTVKREVKEAERMRDILKQPLDDKWLEVNARDLSLDMKEDELNVRDADITIKAAAVLQREMNGQIESERIADERERTKKLLYEADQMNKEAASDLLKSRQKAKELETNAQALERTVSRREKNVSVMEGLVEQRRLENERESNRLTVERVRLRDAWQTLERVKKRLK